MARITNWNMAERPRIWTIGSQNPRFIHCYDNGKSITFVRYKPNNKRTVNWPGLVAVFKITYHV